MLNDKKCMFNIVKNIRALCFSGQAHASCPITPECKKYIPYSEKFQGILCFSGQAQVTQNF